MKRVPLVCLLTFLFAPGCGTDVGNPIVKYTVVNSAQNTVNVTGAWIVVDGLRFYDDAPCGNVPSFVVNSPDSVADLFDNTLPPGAPTVASGDYCRFDVVWGQGKAPLPTGVPPALVDATVVVTGTRTDQVAFTIRSLRTDALSMVATGASFSVRDDTGVLFVAFDGSELIQHVDLDAAAVANGEIIIDGAANNSLLLDFEANFHAAAKLFDDDNNNGVLDGIESDPGQDLAQGQ